MIDLIRKELRLSASVLSFFFIGFGLMFFVPGYPILCGAFFVCLGLFQSFQNTRETNDLLFSALLPVAKRDVVRAKYWFVCAIQGCALLLMTGAILVRMTFLKEAAVYRTNALMNANGFALGLAFLIFGLFNVVFVGGFFKTGYRLTRPFLTYTVVTFLTIGVGESLHYFPHLAWVNGFGTAYGPAQLVSAVVGAGLFALLTGLSCRRSCRLFETMDL